MRRATDVLAQIDKAGLSGYLEGVPLATASSVTGRFRLAALEALAADPRFATGLLYQLHKDVGGDLTEYRAYRGELGPGSLQIVVDKRTGRFYADLDNFNPYQDVVDAVGHAFGEVIPGWLRGLWRGKQGGRDGSKAGGRH